MATGAWQDMFKLYNLEERPFKLHHSHPVLYNDGTNEIVITKVAASCRY